jgi:hypothetical protein
VALVADGAAGDLLRLAAIIGVGRVDEVHPLLARLRDDAAGGRLVGRAAERHGADAERRDFHAAAAEIAVLHGMSLKREVGVVARLTPRANENKT